MVIAAIGIMMKAVFSDNTDASPTRANYERIESSMTKEEVFNLLGPGEMEEQAIFSGRNIYTWKVLGSSDEIKVEFIRGFDQDKLRVLSKYFGPHDPLQGFR